MLELEAERLHFEAEAAEEEKRLQALQESDE